MTMKTDDLFMNAGQAHQIEIERDGTIIHMIVRCESDYDAMMFYDRMTEQMRAGYVKLELMTKEEAARIVMMRP